MSENGYTTEDMPPTVKVVPTIYPTSIPLEQCTEGFWSMGGKLEDIQIDICEPDEPLALLEKLGTSPFPRSGFPVIGFLATTYDKVSRYALEKD